MVRYVVRSDLILNLIVAVSNDGQNGKSPVFSRTGLCKLFITFPTLSLYPYQTIP